MNLNKNILLKSLRDAIVLMWCYAALSKIIDYDKARSEMLAQVFPIWISEILLWAVPAAELLTAALIVYSGTRIAGLRISLGLLTCFTLYIGLVVTGIFGRIPCSCGGIMEGMTWGQHMAFNLFFIATTISALYLTSGQCSGYKTGDVPIIQGKRGAM
jgi:putative oxidoreductase